MTLRFIHKWLGICIGIQVFIWVFSGTVISLLDHQVVSGRSTRSVTTETQDMADFLLSDALPSSSKLAKGIESRIFSVSLIGSNERLVYRFETESGPVLFNAVNGEKIRLTNADAQRIARQSYQGTGQIIEVQRLPSGDAEVNYAQPVWRVAFDDSIATRVYISDADGSVIAHRNRHWRVVDFLLMLHFMDYARQHSFNNPQIIVVAFISLWLSLSGLLLVIKNFSRRDFTKRGLFR